MTASAPLRCKCRRMAPTSLRCSRCFVPICPDCSRPAPVGMLCRDCARGKSSHVYEVDVKSMALAIPVCLAVSLFGGWLLATLHGIGFFGLFAGFAMGAGIGELFLRLNQRKRGLSVELSVGACIILGLLGGYAVQLAFAGMSFGAPPTDLEPIPQPVLLMGYVANPWNWVTIAVCCFGGVSRVRSF